MDSSEIFTTSFGFPANDFDFPVRPAAPGATGNGPDFQIVVHTKQPTKADHVAKVGSLACAELSPDEFLAWAWVHGEFEFTCALNVR